MDIVRAATFITEEDRWLEKLAIGVGVLLVSSVLSVILVGIIGYFIVAGYTVRLMQNVRDGRKQVLPEWNEWSGDLNRGFKLFVVSLVWTLAIWVFIVPFVVGGVMMDANSGFVQFVGGTLMMTSACFMILYGIFVLLAQPGFSIAFAEDEKIRSGLALSKIWVWTRANLGQVIIVAIAVVVASFIIGLAGTLVGSLLCLIGLVVTVPLATLITFIYQYHLYGQLAYAYPLDGGRPVSAAGGDVTGMLEMEAAAEEREDDVSEAEAGESWYASDARDNEQPDA